MKEQKEGKKVSWASGANLCQLRYFKKTDCPAKVGRQTPDHPQLEVSHSYRVVSDGGSANVNLPIPQVPWKTPPKFILRPEWHVAAGEESEERVIQKHREKGVLEALYPCLSSIPPRPFISLNTGGQLCDDTYCPILPITPKEARGEMDLSSPAPSNISIDSPPKNLLQGFSTSATLNIPSCKSVLTPDPSNKGKSAVALSHSLEGDVVLATVAAANAILKSKEPGSLIDTDLLVQLLKNPEMAQELINKHVLSSTTNTRTSESKASTNAVLMPSSQLPIDKSDNENSKPANAGTEPRHKPLVIKLSSSAHAKAASGPKPIQPSVSLLRSTNDHQIKSLSHENNQPANGGNIAAMPISELLPDANAGTGRSSRSEQVMPSVSHTSSTCDLPSEKFAWSQSVSTRSQTVSKPVNQSSAANPDSGTCSQPKQVPLSVSLSCSPPDLLCWKPANKHGQLANIGTVAMLKPVTGEVRTGSAPKTMTPSVSLLMPVCNLPRKKSTSEHSQQADTGNISVPKPEVTQSLAADTDFGIGFRQKTGTPVSVSIKNSTNEYNKQADTGNMVVPKPVVRQTVVADSNFGTGFRGKTGPAVSVPIKTFSAGEHNQQVNAGNEVALKPVVTQSAIVGTGSGFRTQAGTQPVSLPTLTHDLQGKRSSSGQIQRVNTGNMVVATPVVTQPVAANTRTGTGFRVKPGVVSMSVQDLPGKRYPNEADAVAMPVAENQPPSALRINAEFPGTPPNFGPSPVARPVHLTGQNLEISRLKRLVDEHGAHIEGGHAPVAGIYPMSSNPSPDLGMLKKMVSQYGLHDNSEIPLTGSDHLLVPTPVTMFDAFSPLREHRQPPQLKSVPSSTCPTMEFEPKFQKPCLYYNTPKGCRNGSGCRFLHDPKQWRFDDVLEASKTKKMKSG